MKRLIGPIEILGCTFIWGTAFLAQKTGVEHYGPFTLTCYRNILAGLFLLLFCFKGGFRKVELIGGILSGIVLFAAMAAQQLGIEQTTPGISAFLTANYILIVPFLVWLFGRGRPCWNVWLGVGLAVGGTYLICMSPSSGVRTSVWKMGPGEAWTLLCALLFAAQIMVVDAFASKCHVVKFSMVQTFTAAICASPFMALPSETARLTWAHFQAGWFSLFYVGILSSGIAYTLQNLGQARTSAALAAILMSFESVVGAVSGYFVLGDSLTSGQLAGCGCVFLAILSATLIPLTRNG